MEKQADPGTLTGSHIPHSPEAVHWSAQVGGTCHLPRGKYTGPLTSDAAGPHPSHAEIRWKSQPGEEEGRSTEALTGAF